MTKRLTSVGTVAALAIGLTTFTGSAIAGNGNGSTPPGQEKKAEQAAPAAQPAAQPAAAPTASTPPGQAKKAAPAAPSTATPSTATSPGKAKQAAKASSSAPGMKPSSTTSKWTKCSTGGTASSATCAGNGPKADGSKQYGNGKTAAQIAVSRGAPAGTIISGPGNSQPHKVTVCGKPNNKSGGVDVHAVKSYDQSACTPSQSQAQKVETNCVGTTVVTSTTTSHAKTNKHGKVVAHGKKQVSSTTTSTTFTPSFSNCGTASAATAAAAATATPAAPAAGTPVAATAGTPATAQASATAPTAQGTTAGGVLGAQATLTRPAKKPAGGVLGATARLGKVATTGTLPFTGLPLWIVTLVALALIAGGLAFRSGRPSRQL